MLGGMLKKLAMTLVLGTVIAAGSVTPANATEVEPPVSSDVSTMTPTDGDEPVSIDSEWAWDGILLWMYLNKAETRDAQNQSGVLAICGAAALVVGPALAALCAANFAAIAQNASRAVNNGQCLRLHFAPGVIASQAYKNQHCY